MKPQPTFGSLFSGVGGLDLACERVGMRPAWQVEVDPFCREVLAKHWPGVPRYDDVRTVGAATLVPVDVVCGGFPCQDVSLAGRGAGLAGERSGLWYEFHRIVAELRPRGVLVENVQGLVRRGLDAVVRGLVDLGYEVEGTRVAAADIGAPHRRVRVFLVAWRVSDADGPGGLEPGRRSGEGWAVPPAARGRGEGVGDPSGQRQPEPGRELDGGRVATAVGASQDLGYADGCGRAVREDAGPGSAEPHRAGPRLADADGEWQPQQGRAHSDERGWAGYGGAPDEQPTAARGAWGGRPAEPRLGGGADGLPAGLDGPGPGGAWPAGRGQAQHDWEPPRTLASVPRRPARLKALGNAVVPQQGAVAAARLLFRMGAA